MAILWQYQVDKIRIYSCMKVTLNAMVMKIGDVCQESIDFRNSRDWNSICTRWAMVLLTKA
jgi:hypothetical protein